MRPLIRRQVLVSMAALLAGCAADRIAGSARSPEAPLLDREERKSDTYQFTTIDVPGARSTSAQGINARGDIVGTYVDLAGRAHGFVFADGAFTAIDFPGAAGTEARGISPDGEIVGDYWFPGEPAVNFHGYRRTQQGDFVPVHYPGHVNEILQRILPDGTILGCRHDNDLMMTMRGISIGREDASEVDTFASMHNGATPDGRRIVGLWTDMMSGRREGYMIDDGVFHTFVVPGSNLTAAWDVNPAGVIVGVYRTGAGTSTAPFVSHGFIRSDGRRADGDVEYVTLDVPGATSTTAFGINASGVVVGSYAQAGKTYGFVASAR